MAQFTMPASSATSAASSSGGGGYNWGQLAAAVIGGYANAEAQSSANKAAIKNAAQMTEQEARIARQNAVYGRQLDYMTKERAAQRTRNGLKEFRKFKAGDVRPEVYTPTEVSTLNENP